MPKEQGSRRSGKVSRWHADWTKRNEKRSDFRPQGRKEGSDYNLHYVDMDAPLEAQIDFDRRVREIDGRDPDTGRLMPAPDYRERFRGALVTAAAGDALGRAVDAGAVYELPWSPDLKLKGDKALTEYVLRSAVGESSAAAQLMAFTMEGLIRLGVRARGESGQPTPVIQHALQRWLHTQRVPKGHGWNVTGGPYAAHAPQPDGWLVGTEMLYQDGAADPATVAELERFARTGELSSLPQPVARARGAALLPRVAGLAACSNDADAAFLGALNIAALTHNSSDDCLAAGALAVILQQQIRDQPFFDCVTAAQEMLRRRRHAERVLRKIDLALTMNQEYWVPASRQDMRKPFGDGGSDGAEALGLALYCAMASDYVREALQLAMNYSAHRSVVGAVSGLLIGAECGVRAIPADLRAAAPLADVVDTLAEDEIAEYSTNPPRDESWFRRYPGW
ncbi:ADP-ribosylglycohydrolase family protein [Saccharopolyspora erythraea]|uniref:ADP-ribosylglycohydrolase family protein n=1 Tax=Saccharopolyspora erythraea TaxID=1836 RepID=UPI001BAA4A3F|nr:ADP-ribosylglycohydrolase family protein [Saccharopolyspora erythraea]QUH01727.1 ADP-ribosylglycohydrolase family protein [Saccharopolyspora erythraea]